MFHTFIWTTGSQAYRSTISALEVMMESLVPRGGCHRLTVVALGGSDESLDSARSRAGAAGALWLDGRDIFQAVVSKFPRLRESHSDYETRCFLRWLVLRRLLQGHPFRQTWHIDPDMLFFAGLDDLAQDTAGKTFVLQGCPAFASISDPGWFDAYEQGLRALHDTGEPGFRINNQIREEHRRSDQELGNASVYQIPIAHDQDLIECLVGNGRLPQDPWPSVRGTRFYYMQNPLCLGSWHHLASEGVSAMFEDRGEDIFVGERRLPFVHFQADAARFLMARLRAESLGLARWLPHPMSNPSDLASGLSRRYSLAARLLVSTSCLDRGRTMRQSMIRNPKTGNRALTDALNHLLKGAARI